MPPEQLVDVPVPQAPLRSSGSLAYELETRRLLEAARLAPVEEEQMEEDVEVEGVEVSRFLPHFRPLRWCWYVHAGSICPRGWDCTFAHHESELHPDSWWLGLGSGAWHPLDPSWVPLPVLQGRLNILGGTGSGAWHPLTPSWVPSVVCRTTNHGRCGGGSACAYCWERSWYVSVTDHAGTWRWPACAVYFHRCSSWTR